MQIQVQDALHFASYGFTSGASERPLCFFCLSGTSGTVQSLTQDRFGRFVVKRIKKEEDKKAWRSTGKTQVGFGEGSCCISYTWSFVCTSKWCNFYTAAVGLCSMIESSSGIIMLPPTRTALKCIQQGLSCLGRVIACLTSGYWCGRDGHCPAIA